MQSGKYSRFDILRMVFFTKLMQLPIESAKGEIEVNMPIRSIKEHINTTVGPLVGLAIGLAIVLVVSTLSVLNASTSSGLVSATNTIAQFLSIVGLGIVVGILSKVL